MVHVTYRIDTVVLTVVLVYKLFTRPSICQDLVLPGLVPSKEGLEKAVKFQTSLENGANFWSHG